MGIMVYSSLWVRQDLYHQPYVSRAYGLRALRHLQRLASGPGLWVPGFRGFCSKGLSLYDRSSERSLGPKPAAEEKKKSSDKHDEYDAGT